jgi:hypothetical protein
MKETGAQTYATQAITDRWNALIERIQDTIGQIAEGPLGDVVNKFITTIVAIWMAVITSKVTFITYLPLYGQRVHVR